MRLRVYVTKRQRRGRNALHLLKNGMCHFFGQRECPIKLTVVAFRPDVCIVRGANQLQGHVHPGRRPDDRAFHDPVYSEFARNLRQRARRSFVPHRRGAGHDPQGPIFGERGDELVSHSVGEVVLRGVP